MNLTPREVYFAVPVSEAIEKGQYHCFVKKSNGGLRTEYINNDSFENSTYFQDKYSHVLEKITAIPLSEEELDTFILGFVNWKDIKWQYVHVAGKFLPNIKFLDKYGSNYKSNSELLSIYKEELSEKNNNTPKEKEDGRIR